MENYGDMLRQWRRMQGVKQQSLALKLGVSQSTIAKWERGYDIPSAARQKQIRDLVAGAMRDELAIEKLAISRQSAIRTLVDMDGMKHVMISAGYKQVWPEFSLLLGRSLADHLINESQTIAHDRDLFGDIIRGDVAMLSGVSLRHFDVPIDSSVKHRWNMAFRQFGGSIYADVVMEPCAEDLETGITERIYLDDLRRY